MNDHLRGWGGGQYKLRNRPKIQPTQIVDTPVGDSDVVLRDATGGAFDQTLPPAVDNVGRTITINNIGGANDVTAIITVGSGDGIFGTVAVAALQTGSFMAITAGLWQRVGTGT